MSIFANFYAISVPRSSRAKVSTDRLSVTMPPSMATPVTATEMAMTAAMMPPAKVPVAAMGMSVSTAEMTVSAVVVSVPAREDDAAANCGLIAIPVSASAIII